MPTRSRSGVRSRATRARTVVLCIYATVALATYPACTTSLERPTAAFLETHVEEQLSLQDYWHAAVSFREIGFVAHLLSPLTGVTKIHPDNLTDFVSVLLITPRDAQRMVADIDMLAKYVAEGNGIIVAGQASSSEYEPWARSAVNDLTSKFGIEFQRDMVCDPEHPFLNDERYPHWPMIVNFEDHATTEGIELISYSAGCSLNVWGNATPIARTSERAWSDVNGDKKFDAEAERRGEKIVAAVSNYGKGRIACIGDNSLWSSRFLDGFDNNDLLLNLVKWVSREVEEPELKLQALDLDPEAEPAGDGNYSTTVPLRIWNEGTAPVSNLTIYISQGNAEIIGGNLTYESVRAGQVIDEELRLKFSPSNCRYVGVAYTYFIGDESQFETLRTIRLEVNNSLSRIGSIFGNGTAIAVGSSGGWGNYTEEEMVSWANGTRDLVTEWDFVWDVVNHTVAVSKAGNIYSVKSAYVRRDIIGIGDPSNNYLVALASQEGSLRVGPNLTLPSIRSPALLTRISSGEEAVTTFLKMPGNLSDWGYMSMVCEETFLNETDNRLAVGGFGRAGLETAVEVLWRTLRGEMQDYEEDLSGTFALFRGMYEGDELVGLEFL